MCQTVIFFIKANLRYLGHKVVDSEGGFGMLFRRHGEAVDDVKGEVVLESDLLSVQQGPVVLDLGGNEIIIIISFIRVPRPAFSRNSCPHK